VARELSGLIEAETIQITGNKAKMIRIKAIKYLAAMPIWRWRF
jgi:hypothetical protein